MKTNKTAPWLSLSARKNPSNTKGGFGFLDCQVSGQGLMPGFIKPVMLSFIAVFCFLFTGVVFAGYEEADALKAGSIKFAKSFGKSLTENAGESRAVAGYGRMLSKLEEGKIPDANELTVKNPLFWKAVIDAGNSPSIFTTRGFLLSAEGKSARARHIFILAGVQLTEEQLETFLGGYYKLASALSERIGKEMKTGMKYHDAGRYDKAINAYNAVLGGDPGNAWAWYEKGFSYLMLSAKDKSYEAKKENAYKMARELDPLYFMAYQGSDKAVLDKMKILTSKAYAFISGENMTLNTMADFAEACELTGLHDYAAFAFWQLHFLDEEKKEEYLVHFFHNAKMSGCPEVIDYAGRNIRDKIRKLSENE